MTIRQLLAVISLVVGLVITEPRARVTGAKLTFGWIKHLLIGCLQHVGEMAAIVALHQRLRDAEAGR